MTTSSKQRIVRRATTLNKQKARKKTKQKELQHRVNKQ
jgi:hypothetical protein